MLPRIRFLVSMLRPFIQGIKVLLSLGIVHEIMDTWTALETYLRFGVLAYTGDDDCPKYPGTSLSI